MKIHYFKHKSGRFTWTAKQWECCGHIWQLLLSKNFPERKSWSPICPTCGRTNWYPKDYWKGESDG